MSEVLEALPLRLEAVSAALCGAALRAENPGTLLAAAHPEQFRGNRFAKLWARMRELWDGRGALAMHELLAAGDLDAKALAEARAIDVPDPTPVISEFRAISALAEADAIATSHAKRYRATTGTVSEAVAVLQQHVLQLSYVIDELEHGAEEQEGLSKAAEDWIRALQRSPVERWKLTTGLPDLDERFGGGMAPGTLTLVTARPGGGKSSLLCTAAVEAAKEGNRVLYVSREMPERELFGRFLACYRDEPLALIERSVVGGNAQVIEEVLELGILPIAMRDRVAHIAIVQSLVRRERLAGRPFRLVLLDYLQLFDGPGESQHERLEAIAYGAKALALECECALLVAVQPNRDGSKREGLPTMHDLRGSSAIEDAADNIVSMLKAGGGRDMDASLCIGVEKARNGTTGELKEPGQYALGAGTFRVRQIASERAAVEYL